MTNLALASDGLVWLSWELPAEVRVLILRNTNEDISAYVSAGARIQLNGYLYKLRENAIYCDTVSVIFIQPRAEPWSIATGDKLGYMQY